MPVVWLSMELGALDKEVAEGLMDKFGGRPVYGHIVAGIARRMRMSSERVTSVIEGRPSFFDRWILPYDDLRVYAVADLLALAQEGDAIVRGWGADRLFRPVSHIALVRVTAPLARRVENVARILDSDDRGYILAHIKRSDAAYARRLAHRLPGSDASEAFHLTLDTERCSITCCVAQIGALLREPRLRESAESRQALADLTLAAGVEAAVRQADPVANHSVSVTARAGWVKLRGIVRTRRQLTALHDTVGRFPGVRHFSNNVTVMSDDTRYTRRLTAD